MNKYLQPGKSIKEIAQIEYDKYKESRQLNPLDKMLPVAQPAEAMASESGDGVIKLPDFLIPKP